MIVNSKGWQVGDLLEGRYFRIPRYQRPYSWEKSHLEEFFQDVVTERNPDEDYFIGSMVTAKSDAESAYSVVDGQQRLTTITIFLCAIRDVAHAQGAANLASGTHNLIERTNRDNQKQFVLTTETSFPYLQEHVQKFGKPELPVDIGPEEESIAVAFRYFTDTTRGLVEPISLNAGLTPDRKKAAIEGLLKVLRDKLLSLKLIFIELKDEDAAYLVFETLNTRGKDLRVADLVKNLLLRLKKPENRGVDVAKIKWTAIQGFIEESGAAPRLDMFLHHFWLSRHDFVAQKKLFIAMRKTIGPHTIDAVFLELEGDAKRYRTAVEPDFRESWLQQEFGIRSSLQAIESSAFETSESRHLQGRLPTPDFFQREHDAQSAHEVHPDEERVLGRLGDRPCGPNNRASAAPIDGRRPSRHARETGQPAFRPA